LSQEPEEIDVEDACTTLRIKAKTRDMVVERENVRPLNMQPQKEPEEVVEQPQMKRRRGGSLETSTKAKTSNCKKIINEAMKYTEYCGKQIQKHIKQERHKYM